MADWFFSNPSIYDQNQQSGRDGTSPETAWTLAPNRAEVGRVELSQLNDGDTLWILDAHDWGSFNQYFTMDEGTGNITVRGDYPGRTGTLSILTIKVPSVSVLNLDVNKIEIDAATGLTLDNCNVHDSTQGISVTASLPVDNVTIKNCKVYDHSLEGIAVFTWAGTSRNNWQILNNEIYNIGLNSTFPDGDIEGIGLQRVTNCVISGNLIADCDYGINLWESGSGISSDVQIINNHIHRILGGPSQWPSRGIMISGGATTEGCLVNINIANNIIHDIGKEGMRLQAPTNPQGLVVTNNRVYNTHLEFAGGNVIDAPAGWSNSGNVYYSWPKPEHTYQAIRSNGSNGRSWTN